MTTGNPISCAALAASAAATTLEGGTLTPKAASAALPAFFGQGARRGIRHWAYRDAQFNHRTYCPRLANLACEVQRFQRFTLPLQGHDAGGEAFLACGRGH